MTGLPVIAGRDLEPLGYTHDAKHDVTLTQPEFFRPVEGSGWVKPDKGGLWTSPITEWTDSGDPAMTSWLEWCRDENWSNNDCSRLTTIVALPEARILRIDTLADLVAVVDAYPANLEFMPDRRYPDWPRLATEGFDAVYLTDEGQWATRMTEPGLYGWDCATVFWLRPTYAVGATMELSTEGVDA